MRTEKVVAYITCSRQLLVFRHVFFPEAGIQVPAGTVEPGESPEHAVLREAREETGLEDLTLERYLGQDEWQNSDQCVVRRFYHLRCHQRQQDVWQHDEVDPSGGGEPITFELY